ncbi:MAG: hypothetical protein NTZ64_04770 [Polaromonas sp.]|nr:hypothetical protein [Polaromonas sp.]
MTRLTEGTLECEFDEGCEAIKFDATDWHRQQFGHCKAMDILATSQGRHWWIEIKDCQGDELASLPRLSPAEPEEVATTRRWLKEKGFERIVYAERRKPFVIDEVIEKMRDTLVALNFAQRAQDRALEPHAWCGSAQPLTVVLLLTWDAPDFRRLAGRLQQKLTSALLPYGLSGFVVSEHQLRDIGVPCSTSRIPA